MEADNGIEAELRAMFDATAEPLEGPAFTRVRARAAEVPVQKLPGLHRLPRWAWASGFGGLALCAAAAALEFCETDEVRPSNVAPAVAIPTIPTASKAEPAPESANDEVDAASDDSASPVGERKRPSE